MVPVPVGGIHRRGQREAGEVKAHPGATMLHVRPKGGALCRIFRAGIQKYHDVILRQKLRVEVAPIGCRVKAKLILQRQLRKPAPSLLHEADMSRVLFGRIERDDTERRLVSFGAEH